MHLLVEHKVHCPYCGEPIEVLIDTTIEVQEYVEDCQVCCRPIVFVVTTSFDGEIDVAVRHENE
tara:strand:+ start:145 stop:336 length:192 start_codon:yes stop_codon:yes gene_type:complete